MDERSDVYSESRFLATSRTSISKSGSNPRGAASQAGSTQSALKRIVSKKNLNQSTLPAFLRGGSRENFFFGGRVNIDNPQPTKSVSSKLDEIMLTVKNRNLRRRELISLKEGGPLSSNLIEVCLSLIKHMSSHLVKTRQSNINVLISNTAFSENVFSYNRRAKAKTSISNVLIFPLCKSAWALLVVDLKTALAKLYEPASFQYDTTEMYLQLFGFLKDELLLHDRTDILDTPWKDLVVERAETPHVSYEDSGVFIAKLAESVCVGGQPAWDKLSEYRIEILQHLFYNGEKRT